LLTFDNPAKPPFPKERANRLKSKFVPSSYCSDKYLLGFARAHFNKRLKERKLNVNDAINILKTGKIVDEPDFSGGEWRYRVDGGDLVSSKGKASLVVVFKSETVVHCHTIYKRRERR